MKQVTPNLSDIVTVRYVSQLSQMRRFRRYWGTEVINGVEVFTGKRYYYRNMDEEMEKLAKMLGIYTSLKAKQTGIRSAWLWLNPAKASDSSTDWDTTILVKNLNRALGKLRYGSVVVGPKPTRGGGFRSPPIITNVSNQPTLLAEIALNFQTYWDNGYSIFTNQEDGFMAIVLSYILRSNDIPHTTSNAVRLSTAYVRPPSESKVNYTTAVSKYAWRVNVQIPAFNITASTDIVSMIVNDLNSRDTLAAKTIGGIFDSASTLYNTNDGGINDSNNVYDGQVTNASALWLTIPTNTMTYDATTKRYDNRLTYEYYLKTSLFESTSLSREDQLKYLHSCIDTGYKKESKKWYDMLLMVVVIVAAAFFAGPAGAAAATAFTSGAIAATVMIAVSISVAALYISLASMALQLLGAPNVTAALGTFLRAVSPLVKIAGVISIVAALYTVVQEGAKRAAAEALKEGTEVGIRDIVSNVGKIVIEKVTGIPIVTDLQASHVIKMIDVSFGLIQKLDLRSIEKDTENYRKELASYKAAEEQNQTSDVVKDMLASYPNVLAKDESVYSGRYDRPYEWWSTPYHTGNIQATTVNALWLSES